jgi:hypothetical protein
VILVDTSVWVDFFNGVATPESDYLSSSLGSEPIAIGDLILTEILQGFRSDRDYRTARSLLDHLTVFELLNPHLAVKAADRYRRLRKRGITVRKTADAIIGSWCIENRFPLLYSDRDFDPMVEHLGLKSALLR